MKRELSYLKGIVIVHGKSEYTIVEYIRTNLHLTMKTYGKDKGKHSIQITSLMHVLENRPFDTLNHFLQEYGEEIECTGRGKKRILKNFKLFLIMDTDDCTEKQKQEFMDKTMFREHPLYDYIVPIFNTPALEDVMVQCGLMPKKIKDSEKGKWYDKVFPVNKDKPVEDTAEDIKAFKERLEKCQNTNMDVFVTYCLAHIHRRR
ncbi:MAG: hypothetical protein ACI4JQ_02970 [Ruminococcus sp.]